MVGVTVQLAVGHQLVLAVERGERVLLRKGLTSFFFALEHLEEVLVGGFAVKGRADLLLSKDVVVTFFQARAEQVLGLSVSLHHLVLAVLDLQVLCTQLVVLPF